MADDNRFGDVWDRIKEGWDATEDKTKETWDDLVDRVVDTFHGSADWTDDKMNEAKGYFKGRYDEMKRH